MEINIDHKTIRMLMEEDPEFKVKVKAAILATAVKHQAFGTVSGIAKREVDKAITEANAALSCTGLWKPILNSEIKSAISDTVVTEINAHVSSILGEKCEKVRAELLAAVDASIHKSVNIRVEQHINSAVRDRLEQIMTALEEK